MWQHHYLIHVMRMQELRAEADRQRHWRLSESSPDGAPSVRLPSRGRVIAAHGIAALSRGAAHVARRLDARVAVELGPDRVLRDA